MLIQPVQPPQGYGLDVGRVAGVDILMADFPVGVIQIGLHGRPVSAEKSIRKGHNGPLCTGIGGLCQRGEGVADLGKGGAVALHSLCKVPGSQPEGALHTGTDIVDILHPGIPLGSVLHMQHRPVPVPASLHGGCPQAVQGILGLVGGGGGQHSGEKFNLDFAHRRIGADTLQRGNEGAALALGHGKFGFVIADLKIGLVSALPCGNLPQGAVFKAVAAHHRPGIGVLRFQQDPSLRIRLQGCPTQQGEAVLIYPTGGIP